MKAEICVFLALADTSLAAIMTRTTEYQANVSVLNQFGEPVNVLVQHYYGLFCLPQDGEQLTWSDLRPNQVASPERSVAYSTGELKADWWRVSWSGKNGHVLCSTGLGKMHNLDQSDSQSTNIITIRADGVSYFSTSGSSSESIKCTCDYSKDASGIFHSVDDWSQERVTATAWLNNNVCTCNDRGRC